MNQRKKLIKGFAQLREKQPLILHLTNIVAMEEQAHITLAAGARPIMSDSSDEAKELASIADALLLNIGMPNHDQMDSMKFALEKAKERKIPVMLDPVGYGASRIRNQIVDELIQMGGISIIKGNSGEIATLFGKKGAVSGVDSTLSQSDEIKQIVVQLSQQKSITIAATGKQDYVANESHAAVLSGGSKLLTKVSGSGCMAGSLIACFMAAGLDPFYAGIAGILMMKIAAEKAEKRSLGSGLFSKIMIDEVFHFSESDFSLRGMIEWS
jgi:hydroxyethylthiazole kinase